jgi:hypothetical protein
MARARRSGGFSLIRVGIIAGVVGFLIIAVAVLAYLKDQNDKRSPFEISPYPNAVYWGTSEIHDTSRNVFYRVADTPESVVAYYQQKLNEHYGNTDQSCVRLPATGNAPGSQTDSSIVPYLFRCVFDNSGFNTSQYTQVEIYPGRADPDPNRNAEGLTVVKYMEYWMR